MYTKSRDAGIYLGRDAGRDLYNTILNANKSVKIVSPYLNPDYIKKLVNLKEKGVDVTLITSDYLEEKTEEGPYGPYSSHMNFIKQDRKIDEDSVRRRSTNIRFTFACLVISIALMILGVFNIILSIIGLIGLLLIFFGIWACLQTVIYSYSYYPIFRLRVFFSKSWGSYLIHAKIYVIDDKVAFLGSTNFTYSGCVKSYESSIKITDPYAVGFISREVDNLFNNTQLQFLNIQEWGKKLYAEPPHELSYWQIIGSSLSSK